MQFGRSVLFALLSAAVSFAQSSSNANPFNSVPGFSATAGTPTTLTWKVTTPGTVSLYLRYGPSNNLNPGTVIVTGIANSGSYTWTPSSALPTRSDYTVEIVSDADTSAFNFYPSFTITNPNPVTSVSLTSATQSLPTTSISLSTITPSSTLTTTTSGSSTSSSASGSTTSSVSRSSSASGSTTSSASTTTSSNGAGFASSSPHTNAAPRATAMAGFLGVVALGALAL